MKFFSCFCYNGAKKRRRRRKEWAFFANPYLLNPNLFFIDGDYKFEVAQIRLRCSQKRHTQEQ